MDAHSASKAAWYFAKRFVAPAIALHVLAMGSIMIAACSSFAGSSEKRIAFISSRMTGPIRVGDVVSSDGDLFVMNADGSGQKRVTHDLLVNGPATWSRDGESIAFTAGNIKEPGLSLYVVQKDGSNLKLISTGHQYARSPAWSSDGKRLAFSAGDSPGWNIYTADLEDSRVTAITTGLDRNDYPSWSPDGRRIAFFSSGFRPPSASSIHVIDMDDGKTTTVAELVPEIQPAWSPDGRKLAYVDRSDNAPGIYSVSSDGANKKRLTEYGTYPVWSSDGSHIAYLRSQSTGYQLNVIDANGLNNRSIVEHIPARPWLDWQKDGGRILYQCLSGDRLQLCSINSDGKTPAPLTDSTGFNIDGRWSP